MKSALNKDIVRDINKSKGRFFSIAGITALGVLLFTGVKHSPEVMKFNADKYYDDYNLMDIRVVSTLGLTDDDITSIENINNVNGVYPYKTVDALVKANNSDLVVRFHNYSNSKNIINNLNVLEGKLPSNENECVISADKIKQYNYQIGDEITLTSGTDEDILDSLNFNTYKIVGIIETPYYMAGQVGSTNIGAGTINAYAYILDSNFKSDIYSDIFVTVEGAKGINSYKEEYFDLIDKVTSDIEAISDSIITRRHNSILDTAYEELNEAKEEFNTNKEKAEKELSDAKNKLDNGFNQLSSGESKLKTEESNFYNKIASGEKAIKEAKALLESQEKEYNKNLALFNDMKPSVEQSFKDAEKAIADGELALNMLNLKKAEIDKKLEDTSLSVDEIAKLEAERSILISSIETATAQLSAGKKELASKRAEFEAQEQQLNFAGVQIEEGKAKIEKESVSLAEGKATGIASFKKAKEEINKNKTTLENGLKEYNEKKTEAYEKFEEAEEEIAKAEKEISEIEKPELYVLDRKSHFAYMDFENSANSIKNLADIFPMFFFLVAALVCMTTMTRMVDEQRINIGTLKALGYGKLDISKKFMLYGMFASSIGVIIGIAGGFTFIPAIIYNSYNLLYGLPPMLFTFDTVLALSSAFVAIGVTLFSTFTSCRIELREEPSILMLPKAPKAGKRILLERIPFIWNKLGFMGKVTVRNIFRYKKRFFMTVIGIAGSTALLLSGFGIKDSLSTLVDTQFNELTKYDLSATLNSSIEDSLVLDIKNQLSSNNLVNDYIETMSDNITVHSGENKQDAIIIASSDKTKFPEFISLRNRLTKETYDLSNDGVVLTEKLAKLLDVSVGDSIEINNKIIEVKGVVENYMQHYVYVSSNLYENIFDETFKANSILINTKNDNIDDVSSAVINMDGVVAVSNNKTLADSFNDTFENLDFVILVMVVLAGALSFIVLYNLTNVNILERIREIATIKVLGFYDMEVASYIFRENIILSFIGAIVGLFLGVALHRLIIVNVEMDYVMFGRTIYSYSFIISATLTMVFSGIVNFAMYFKLIKVKMIESLKSVE